jgi:uncharacterized membrane protein
MPDEIPTAPFPEPAPTSSGGSGLEPNVAGALSYLLGALTGIVFLLIDKDRPFVRFHAVQSIAVSVALVGAWVVVSLVMLVLNVLPIIGTLIGFLLWLALAVLGFALWIYLMYKAFHGKQWAVPVLAPYVRKYAEQITAGDGQ